jgi:DNA-binding HxlR family transcriptional regulator
MTGMQRARCAGLIRESLGLMTSKWSVDVLLALGDGTRRYHELLYELEPISEKVLTQTLRAMERDGLLTRTVHAQVPPRVDYELTPLGGSLTDPIAALTDWAETHVSVILSARDDYDAGADAR